jgi:hypothetical protein
MLHSFELDNYTSIVHKVDHITGIRVNPFVVQLSIFVLQNRRIIPATKLHLQNSAPGGVPAAEDGGLSKI